MSAIRSHRGPALALVLGALLAVSAWPARAVALAGFSARPATFNPADPTTRAYFKPIVRAGRSYHSGVIVTNAGAAPIKLLIAPVDGVTAVTSGAVYQNAGVPRRGAGRWLRVRLRVLTVPAHSERTVRFSIHVPAHATPGDHLAGIALQDATPAHSRGRLAITELFRVVVGVEIRVPGPTHAAVSLSDPSLAALPGTTLGSVVVHLENRGRVLCKPTLSVTLSGNGPARSQARRLDTVLPGDTIPYPLPWPTTLKGTYDITATATGCGPQAKLSGIVSTGKRLNGFAVHPSASPPDPQHDDLLMLILAVLAALAVGVGTGVLIGRRRRRDEQPPADPAPAVAGAVDAPPEGPPVLAGTPEG